jgi:hypothetical protein
MRWSSPSQRIIKPLMLVFLVITAPFPDPRHQCLHGTFHCYPLSEMLLWLILFGVVLSRGLFSQPRIPSVCLASLLDGEATHADPLMYPIRAVYELILSHQRSH